MIETHLNATRIAGRKVEKAFRVGRQSPEEIHVTWPRGVVGSLFVIATLLMPAWMLFFGAWLGEWMARRNSGGRGDAA